MANLKKELTIDGQIVSLTTNCWTSRQQITYLCLTVTAHWIDCNWCLKKRILSFVQIPNHKGKSIAKLIESCLQTWGIERVYSITLDNAFANDVAVGILKRRVNGWNWVVLGGDFMHVRCTAHIINLIMDYGLKEMHESICAIRNVIRYIRLSTAGLQKFVMRVLKEKIEFKGKLILDCAIQWQSTYKMLDVALKCQKTFERYEEEDDNATNSVSINCFYNKFCELHNQINELNQNDDNLFVTLLIEKTLNRLLDVYGGRSKLIINSNDESAELTTTASTNQCKTFLANFIKHQEENYVLESCNEVEKYLGDDNVNPLTPSFDILLWWKVNSTKYNILAMIAQDMLAVPISSFFILETHIDGSIYRRDQNEEMKLMVSSEVDELVSSCCPRIAATTEGSKWPAGTGAAVRAAWQLAGF
ncbi:hypothetical protein UlMin_031188 [Ulmus minor]